MKYFLNVEIQYKETLAWQVLEKVEYSKLYAVVQSFILANSSFIYNTTKIKKKPLILRRVQRQVSTSYS